MTEKNIFVYKLFLSLNISDFILFYFIFRKIATPPRPPPSSSSSHLHTMYVFLIFWRYISDIFGDNQRIFQAW